MTSRSVGIFGTITVALGVFAFTAVGPRAQSTAPAAGSPAGGAKAAVPRTAWGHPDLTGTWDFRTVTPLERPKELGDKATLTEEEAAEYAKRMVESRNADANRDKEARRKVNGTDETEDVALAYNDFWWDRGTKVVGTRRTSLIVEPADGRIPALTPAGEKRAEQRRIAAERPAWGPEDRSVGERCILGFNAGPPMSPGGYNMNVQIFQTKDNVALLNEMVHTSRIVPLDGRTMPNIPQWIGQSTGKWEGDTFVVDTKNFYDKTSLQNSSPSLHLIEKFTRVDENTLMYEYTVDDPQTWTKPWTVQLPMVKSDGPIYEYACHEGNYGMTGLLSGARAIEKTGKPAKHGTN